jgi:DNA-binding transcriptional MerR regulator
VQTLRYYERRGLLTHPERNTAGHRQYPAHTVTLLRMIKNAQRLGISLGEIADLIKNDPGPDGISAIAERRLAEIDAQIAQLTLIRGVLAGYARRPPAIEDGEVQPAPRSADSHRWGRR